MRKFYIGCSALLVFSLIALSGCGDSKTSRETVNIPPDTSTTDPVNPPIPSPSPTPTTSPTPVPSTTSTTAVLLFNGTGVSTSDWQSTEQIVQGQGLSYQLVNTAQMNAMTLDQLSQFGVIVVPGGSGGTIAGSLTSAARLNIRQAVRDRGVGYVGFCAGAFIAVGPEANTNQTASYGLAVAGGSVLSYYYPNGDSSLTAAIVKVSFSDQSQRSMVWWGGPATPEWTGGVIGRYPNGKPAVSETFSGKGLVVLSGVHPEAPQSWRQTAGTDPDGLDYDIAIAMIRAAIHKQPLAHF